MSAPGHVIVLTLAQLRRLIATAPEISDTILTAYAARRAILMNAPASTVRLIGSRYSADTLAAREFLVRNQIPHEWLDIDAHPDIERLAAEFGLQPADYPVAVTGGPVFRNATPGTLGSYLGLTGASTPEHCADLVVVGAGPAGLAAAVYAASEGLDTLVIESVAPGGQAGMSARVENYLGFPSGVSGLELSTRALAQARKFGATLTTPCEAACFGERDGHLTATLTDGTTLVGRSMVVATGARYRRLNVDRIRSLEGAGVYYAATDIEVRLCAGAPVVVVGGGNSAGQAALHLAKAGCTVRLVIRSNDLSSSMSSYLADRIGADPRIALHAQTVLTALHGDTLLTGVTLEKRHHRNIDLEAVGLFSFIGADPATDWLGGQVEADDRGFIRTDRDLDPSGLGPAWRTLGRDPLPYETNRIGLFAAGDARSGSVKRVAAAVGEGSAVVRSVHDHLAFAH